MNPRPIQARALSNVELKELLEKKWLHEPQHMYLLHNLFVALGTIKDVRESFQGEFFGAFSAEGLQGLMVLRPGYSFVLGECSRDAAASFASVLLHAPTPPRLGIGPTQAMASLLRSLGRRMKVRFERSQPFMAILRGTSLGPGIGPEAALRRARAQDAEWLVRANLTLNHEDLQFDPRLIHMGKLRERIQGRIERGETWILEVADKPVSKLDLGFEGPAGALIEGVFTAMEWRGKGMGTRLVSALCAILLERVERVGLHHARDNIPARKAYLAAGLEEVADSRLVLFH